MADVVFVREIAGGRDLVLAIDHDGRPAWALDLDRDLQWWYPGGDTPGVRAAIAAARPGFATLPVAAVTPGSGEHPAVELGRRAERAAYAETFDAAPPPGDDLVSLVLERWASASRTTRLALASVGLALLVVLLSSLLGGVSAPPAPLPVGDDGMTVSTVQEAGAPCQTRGTIAYDADGQRLVCVPPSRAMPSDLEWRPVG